jgi:PleD family two-component response regulator
MPGMPKTARKMVRSTVTASTGAAPHALLADSEATARTRRVAELAAAGFRVSLARTAFEAIVKASCQLPDVILLGGLPDIGAAETSRLLATCPVTSHIPIVRLMPGRRVPARKILQFAG